MLSPVPHHSAWRGRTSRGRLSLLDTYWEPLEKHLHGSRSETNELIAVDLGFGDSAVTTHQWGEVLRRRYERVRLVGVESSASRVARAESDSRSRLRNARDRSSLRMAGDCEFLVGGFELSGLGLGEIACVRAMNVLRGYREEEIAPAQRRILCSLVDGGVLIEGSTDVEGHLLTAHLWQRQGDAARYRGLFIATDFERGFAPRMFRDVLPRDLRRRVAPGEPVGDWLAEWQTEFSRVARLSGRPRASVQARRAESVRRFIESSARLPQTRLLPANEQGAAVLWTPATPSHRSTVLAPGPLEHPGAVSSSSPAGDDRAGRPECPIAESGSHDS